MFENIVAIILANAQNDLLLNSFVQNHTLLCL